MTTTNPTRLRRAREIAGLSLAQAAKLLDITSELLEFCENCGPCGDPLASRMLVAMARLYQTTVAYLLGDAPKISPQNETLLRQIDDTNDRATVREVMELWSTPEREGCPAPRRAKTLDQIRVERATSELDPADVPIESKRSHVAAQRQTRDHHCHWPGCGKQVPPAMWGCLVHWRKLPKRLRDRIWATYAPGQEIDMSPSAEYLDVADEVQRWIREHGK